MVIPILCKSLLFSLTVLYLLLLLCEQNIYISYLHFLEPNMIFSLSQKKEFFFFGYGMVLVTIINCYQIFLLLVISKYSVTEES